MHKLNLHCGSYIYFDEVDCTYKFIGKNNKVLAHYIVDKKFLASVSKSIREDFIIGMVLYVINKGLGNNKFYDSDYLSIDNYLAEQMEYWNIICDNILPYKGIYYKTNIFTSMYIDYKIKDNLFYIYFSDTTLVIDLKQNQLDTHNIILALATYSKFMYTSDIYIDIDKCVGIFKH